VPRRDRLFRSPRHSISDAGRVPADDAERRRGGTSGCGGGSVPRPGEADLAYHGVLFLDELPEFRHNTLELVYEPLKDVTIILLGSPPESRRWRQSSHPAQQHGCAEHPICYMNPCPCSH
jgi:magnesium chelatase family protein